VIDCFAAFPVHVVMACRHRSELTFVHTLWHGTQFLTTRKRTSKDPSLMSARSIGNHVTRASDISRKQCPHAFLQLVARQPVIKLFLRSLQWIRLKSSPLCSRCKRMQSLPWDSASEAGRDSRVCFQPFRYFLWQSRHLKVACWCRLVAARALVVPVRL